MSHDMTYSDTAYSPAMSYCIANMGIDRDTYLFSAAAGNRRRGALDNPQRDGVDSSEAGDGTERRSALCVRMSRTMLRPYLKYSTHPPKMGVHI